MINDGIRVWDGDRGHYIVYATDYDALTARLAIAEDGWHMANGVADLAMKHRDAAEARLAEADRLLLEYRDGPVPTRAAIDAYFGTADSASE